MFDIKYGYKVLFMFRETGYWSNCFSNDITAYRSPTYALRYALDDWTYGDNGPLMLFDNKRHADVFGRTYSETTEVAYIPIEPRTEKVLPTWHTIKGYPVDTVKQYWQDPSSYVETINPGAEPSWTPYGTVFAAAIFVLNQLRAPLSADEYRVNQIIATYGRQRAEG